MQPPGELLLLWDADVAPNILLIKLVKMEQRSNFKTWIFESIRRTIRETFQENTMGNVFLHEKFGKYWYFTFTNVTSE